MIKSNYKIVRRVLKILQSDARILSDSAINQRIEKVKQESIETARIIGISISNMDISIDYYPDCLPMFHPAGLLNHIPKTWQECLASSCEPCVVSIVIRDKSES